MKPSHKRAPLQPGCLYIVGTPIGNLEDITYRAVRTLQEVDLIAAEDTRSARVLLDRYQIKARTVSFFKGNEAKRSSMLIEKLTEGQAVALISESGMPGISDPGSRLIVRCIEASIPVDVIPGPNAALTALILSGLASDRFTFLGFLPRASGKRRRLLSQLVEDPSTLMIYEAPLRVAQTLAELLELLGDRRAAVVREITKLFQEANRAPLSQLAAQYQQQPPRGEVTLIIEGSQNQQLFSTSELTAQVKERLLQGATPRQIASDLATFGRRRVYQTALSLMADPAGENTEADL